MRFTSDAVKRAGIVPHHFVDDAFRYAGQRFERRQQVALFKGIVVAVVRTDHQIVFTDAAHYDGEVLAGATETILRCHPAIIFEWHPKLILATRSDLFCGFETLAECGYSRFLWFNNIGTFSHFTGVSNRETLQKMTDLLLAVNYRQDEHFDVIALQAGSEINEIELAAMNYARTWGKGK